METLLKADIFFFITSIVVVLVGILFSVVLVLLIRILNDIRDIAALAKKEAEALQADFAEVRHDVRAGVKATKAFVTGASIKSALSFLMNTVSETMQHKRRRTRRRTSDE